MERGVCNRAQAFGERKHSGRNRAQGFDNRARSFNKRAGSVNRRAGSFRHRAYAIRCHTLLTHKRDVIHKKGDRLALPGRYPAEAGFDSAEVFAR